MANAQIAEIAAINDHDNVMSVLKFASGTIGMINVNRFAVYGYDQRLEVFGTKGMLQMENKKPNNVVHSSSGGERVCPIMHSFPSRYEDSYAAELDHFVDIIQEKTSLSITHHVASAVSKIADAMELSAKSGQPVNLV